MKKMQNQKSDVSRMLWNGGCLLCAGVFSWLAITATLDFRQARHYEPVAARVTAETEAGAPQGSEAGSPDRTEPQFLLRAYEGKVAIYRPNEAEPLEVLEIYVSHLPDLDISRLEAGIAVADEEELLRYLEDFDS